MAFFTEMDRLTPTGVGTDDDEEAQARFTSTRRRLTQAASLWSGCWALGNRALWHVKQSHSWVNQCHWHWIRYLLLHVNCHWLTFNLIDSLGPVTCLFFVNWFPETKLPALCSPLLRPALKPCFQTSWARFTTSDCTPGSRCNREITRTCISLSRGLANRFWNVSFKAPKSRSNGEVEELARHNALAKHLTSASWGCECPRVLTAHTHAFRSAKLSLSSIRSPCIQAEWNYFNSKPQLFKQLKFTYNTMPRNFVWMQCTRNPWSFWLAWVSHVFHQKFGRSCQDLSSRLLRQAEDEAGTR